MNNITHKNVFHLRDSIVPQTFFVCDNDIYYFDKTNKYEGRFCIKDNTGERAILETGEGQGVFDNNGDMYILNIDTVTETTKCTAKNCSKVNFELEGIFFDFKVDENGNYIFLGNIDGETVVKLLDAVGHEKGTVKVQGVIFGSCFYVCGEYIYLGAVGKDNRFKILKLNYIGSIISSWDINVKSVNRVISRIELFNNYAVMFIGGVNESIVIFDMISGYTKEVFPSQLELNVFSDICFKNKYIYILSERKIIEYQFDELKNEKILKKMTAFRFDFDICLYQKLMYSIEFYECIERYFPVSIGLSFFTYLILYIYAFVNPVKIIESVISILVFSCIFVYCIATIACIAALGKKSNRIEKLLNIYSENYSHDGVFFVSLYNAAAAEVLIYAIFYPEIYERLYILTGIAVLGTGVLLNYTAEKRIKLKKEDIIIELLEDDDIQVKKYIKNFANEMNSKNARTLRINIVTDDKIDENSAAGWFKSRSIILKNDIKWDISDNTMTAILDLSFRDIRYSRFNIIMDFICYMRTKMRVRELKIEIIDE